MSYQALRFGEFTLKSGRVSPYFFNAGSFNDGAGMAALARCYAAAIQASRIEFDMLFGPAYKGIPLAAAIAISLSRDFDRNVPFAFNRKEAKDHGEGGLIVGAPLAGRVLIVDDVISAGTSIRESRNLITAHAAQACGVAIALDRQERGPDQRSAVAAVRDDGLDVVTVATLDDLIDWLSERQPEQADLSAMLAYRERYGA
ncbi:MAG: orotate phosphoribosyltransferase [Wenzhouxiangella sp.]|nr:MAG: orotate phosphoribosyltransferase [Wenzhouxiangella sp.]